MIGPKDVPATSKEERAAYRAVTIRDDGKCQRCLRDCGPVQRDHRKNRSQGGRTDLINLVLLGMNCHIWKTEHPAAAVTEGFAVPGWANPAQFPARRWLPTPHGTYRAAWVLLKLDGTWVEVTEQDAAHRRHGRAM